MTDLHEHVFNHRTAATRGIVLAVDDTGCAQTVDAMTHDGVTRGAVEVHQPFGVTSVPPANGGVVVLIANGGDPSDLVALPAGVPLCRLGGLQPGETAIYAVDGTRVHIRQGGIVDVQAAAQVLITAPSCTITCTGGITLAADVTITGSLTVAGMFSTGADGSIGGNLTVSGNIDAGGNIHADGTVSGA
jgi:phage baseplate assembly protein V